MEMHPLFLFLDPYLIWFYRLTGHGFADFLLGTLVLACFALIAGKITIALAFLATRKRVEKFSQEALKYQDLSLEALKAGNKEAYRAANKLASDSFGHSFFMQIALSAAFLWPAFFALAWMQYRFLGVEVPLPFLGFSLGFIGVFIILYAAVYFLGTRVKKKLSYFSRMQAIFDSKLTQSREQQGLPALPTPINHSEHK